MVSTKYANAIKEVLHYLKGISEEDVKKIPKKLIDFLEENASKEYTCNFDYTKPLKDITISDEAKGLITYICYSYWCETEDEKKVFLNKLNENEIVFQNELRKKYNVENFNKKLNKEACSKNAFLDKSKKESKIYCFFKKIVCKIKNKQKN